MKRLTIVSLLVLLTMIVGACAAPAAPAQPAAPAAAEPTAAPAVEEAPASGGPGSPEPTTAEEPAATGDTVTITVAAGAVGQELELTQAAAARYMEMHPEVTIEVLSTPDLANDRLGLYLQFFEAQSSEVDVYQIDVIWPGDLAEHLVDLNEYGGGRSGEGRTSPPSSPTTRSTASWSASRGSRTPACSTTAPTCWRSTASAAPPATWAELEEMAQTIQDGERAAQPGLLGLCVAGQRLRGSDLRRAGVD